MTARVLKQPGIDCICKHEPVEVPYEPADAPYRPTDASYKPVDASYRPVDAPYRPVDAPYRPVDASYGPEVSFDAVFNSPIDPSYRPKILKGSRGRVSVQDESFRSVLVLYCGGTIGMKNKNGVYVSEPNLLVDELRKLPTFHDPSYPVEKIIFPPSASLGQLENSKPLTLPATNDGIRIVYTVCEYEPLLDSSNMTYNDYIRLANDIQENYKVYDGFVILHGTDTMAFTASALSYMLENLGKPVVLTGSQIPIFELRSDGRSNFINALILAGTVLIPEVTLYFNCTLFRGNRCTKSDSCSFEAFTSPNAEPLAKIEVDIKVNWNSVFRHQGMKKFRVSTNMCPDVAVLRLFPNITENTVRAFLQPPMMGVVLQTYGQGNGPDARKDLMRALEEACDRGVIIVNISQCSKGNVSTLYAGGKVLADIGVVPGSDMTVEAALMKLSYVLGKSSLSIQEKRQMMGVSLRGELTEVFSDEVHNNEKVNMAIFESVARSLSLSSGREIQALKDKLFPYLLNSAAHEGNIDALEQFYQEGAHFGMCDYDGRTPLHIACCDGNAAVARYLLEKGAPVHQRDRFSNSPLDNALQFKRKEIVRLLTRTGAHLSNMTAKHVNYFFSAVIYDDAATVQMWHEAGVDVNAAGLDGRTALHHAVALNLPDKVRLLLELGADPRRPDLEGRTPAEDANVSNIDDLSDSVSMPKWRRGK